MTIAWTVGGGETLSLHSAVRESDRAGVGRMPAHASIGGQGFAQTMVPGVSHALRRPVRAGSRIRPMSDPRHPDTPQPIAGRPLRLSTRLALGVGALVVLMAAVVTMATHQLRILAHHSEQIVQSDLRRMLWVQEVDQHIQGHGAAMARLLTAPRSERERIYPLIDAEYAALERLVATLATHPSTAGGDALLDALVSRRDDYRDIFIEVVTEIEAGGLSEAKALFNDKGERAMASMLAASQALLKFEQRSLEQRQEAMHARIARSKWLLGGLALAAFILAIVLSWRTTVSVARPLARLEALAGRIAKGEYTERIAVPRRDELGNVAHAMNSMAQAVAARETELAQVAFQDGLTGLPNRAMLARLASERQWRDVTVFLMEVARMRVVNQVLGFATGDALVRLVAQRLRDAIAALGIGSQAPVLARLPGGAFAMVVQGVTRADAERLRAHLVGVAGIPMNCDGHSVDVQIVCGMADGPAWTPERGVVIDSLLQRAELALGEARRSKIDWAWHVPANDAERERQLGLLSQLRRAALAGELEMWLQPKRCLRTQRTTGMEALVRWRHPERGYVSPADFIPFAEQTGAIGVVTGVMLEAALARLASWSRTHPALSIAVNVSALDLRDEAFPRRIVESAARLKAPLGNLRLEITESMVMDDPQRMLGVLRELREIGVRLSIDDFGTGYSSLAYLQRLPVDELKIDRGFVAQADRDAAAGALLSTIVDLGHRLQMTVTAEGIERAEEWALLARLGCDFGQGYLFSKPLSPEAATRYVAALATDPTFALAD